MRQGGRYRCGRSHFYLCYIFDHKYCHRGKCDQTLERRRLSETSGSEMIEEGMSDKEKEIIRATWPGIYMRPRQDHKDKPPQAEDGVKFHGNVHKGP